MRVSRGASASVAGMAMLIAAGAHAGPAAASTDVQPTPESIQAALEHQVQAYGPSLDVSYTYTRDTEEGVEWPCRYVKTPDIVYLEVTTLPRGVVYRHSYEWASREFRMLLSYPDGKMAGQVASMPLGMLQGQTMPDPVDFPLWDGSLRDLIGRGAVSLDREPIDGSMCWRVSLSSDVTVWVDPDIGFLPRRIERMLPYLPDARSFECRDYREIQPGVWYPMELRYPRSESRAVERICKVTSVTIGEMLSPSDLRVTFPSGTPMTDGDTETEFTQP